jgi:hypothetical protein
MRYPFYSVDSTSWLNPSIYGQHFKFDKGKLVRISAKNKPMNVAFSKKKQLIISIKEWLLGEQFITKLWKKRGVRWE